MLKKTVSELSKVENNKSALLQTEEFGTLLNADKNRLYAYIFAFVADRTIADDVFQETCLTLWQEFEKFERGTNFSKWANVIAFNRIRHYRYAQKKYQLGLSKADQSRDPLFRTRPGTTMRQGKWKLHHYFEDDGYELYDLENDLGEHVNLAPHLPKLMMSLKKELNSWRKSIDAPIPTELNPKFDEAFTAELTAKRLLQKSRK